MAQQESLIKLKGKIGDLTFYKTWNGYQARETKGIDGVRIAAPNNIKRGTAKAATPFFMNCRERTSIHIIPV